MSKPIEVDLNAPEPAAPLVDDLLRRYGTPERTSDDVIDHAAGRVLDEMEPERWDGLE